MEVNDQTLTELLRLTKENNRMIHAMRRNAFLGTVVKLVLYALIFVAAPLWLYTSYLAPMLDQLLNTYQQIQGTGAQAQAQLSDLQGFFEQFKNGFSSGE